MKKWIALVVMVAACKKGHKLEVGPVALPFGPTKDVVFGMTSKDFEKSHPDFQYAGDGFVGDYDVEGKWNLISRVDLDDERVVAIRLEIQHHEFLDTIEKAWGPSVDTQVGYSHELVKRYFNESSGTRADISPRFFTVELVPYKPLAKQLDGPDPFSLMGVKILGRPTAEVVADLEKQRCHAVKPDKAEKTDKVVLSVPGSEWTKQGGVLVLESDAKGLVSQWRLIVADRSTVDEARIALGELFKKKWGEPRMDGYNSVYGTAPSVVWDGDSLTGSATP